MCKGEFLLIFSPVLTIHKFLFIWGREGIRRSTPCSPAVRLLIILKEVTGKPLSNGRKLRN